MKITPDLSSGFGDPRDGRFHAGVDFRTGGVSGQRIFAPASGSITRLRASYTGYGKAIYLTDSRGQITVYAHLSGYVPRLDSLVKQAQVKNKRYLLDLVIPRDSIKVEQGELIGWSGQTGVGAPHLHFEVRTADNYPLNPLKNGYALPDAVPPRIKSLMVQLLDGSGTFPSGKRQETLSIVPAAKGGYRLEKPLVMRHPFGFLIDADDRLRAEGMTVAIYDAKILLDKETIYQSRFDTLDFEDGVSVRLEYDYLLKSNDNREVRTLFGQQGNDRSAKLTNLQSGRFGSKFPLTYGKHDFTITVADAAGNSNSVTGTLYWLPESRIDSLVSKKVISDTVRNFQVQMHPELLTMKPTSTVEQAAGSIWKPAELTTVKKKGNLLEIEVTSPTVDRLCLRLRHRLPDGTIFTEQPFTPIPPFGVKSVEGSHEILPDGLLLTLQTNSRNRLIFMARLYQDSTLIDSVFGKFKNTSLYTCFLEPAAKYRKITRIEYVLSALDSVGQMNLLLPLDKEENLHIAAIGFKEEDTLAFNPTGTLMVQRSNLFSPRFVELQSNLIANKSGVGVVADHYKLLPEVMPLREPMRVRLLLGDTSGFARRSGLVWLDAKKDKWTWIPTSDLSPTSGGLFAVSGTTNGGGSFSIAQDLNPPQIGYVSISPGRYFSNPRPKISFTLKDDLSGIADDRSIEVYIGKEWMIPEFDPEQSLCTIQPLSNLPDGEHRLSVKVRDRAGNEVEDFVRFNIRVDNASQNQKKKK
jgi:hypothetical protein